MMTAFVFSIVVTGLVRRYSINKQIIDVPNERSSHSKPTPRGGGLSISLSLILGIVWLSYFDMLTIQITFAFFLSVFIIAFTGWLDDHRDIPFYWRVVMYSVASLVLLFETGGLESIRIGDVIIEMPLIMGYIITFLGIVWLTNLYNFMDGTDALASIQAICASLFAGWMLYQNEGYELAMICFIIAASCLGFLYWNRPPAKIFMGDVGSCVLGFMFAMLSLLSDLAGLLPVYIWCILLSLFICDATFTLIKRIVGREKWYQAHRSHAYQRLVQMGMSHGRLALLVFIINVLLLWPAAYLAYNYPVYSLAISIWIIVLMFILWGWVQFFLNQAPRLKI